MKQRKKTIYIKIFLFFFSLFAIGIFLLTETHTDLPNEESVEGKLAPGDWFYRQRAYPYETINKKAFVESRKYRQALLREKEDQAVSRNDNSWIFAGPTNIGGRVTDIEMPASSQEIIYVGTAAGGIFKSTNQGDSWIPIFEDALSLAIGDMAIAPSDENVIYVGTGEANAGGGSLAYDGLGVYKSVDAGATWQFIGLEHVGSIGKVIVDPTDADIVYVAAMGDLFGKTNDRGVYKSLDGGENWEKVLFVSDVTGAIDLAIDPTNSSIIFAAMWERSGKPHKNIYGGAGSGIYRSTNGGSTWAKLSAGLPTDPTQKGRIALAIAPSDPQIVYAFYAKSNGHVKGIYRSSDGGVNWASKSVSGITSVPYMWWFGKLVVHPTEADNIYFPGFDNVRSTNGGSSWSDIFSGVHVDQHALFIHPANPNLVLVGNDGGVYISANGGVSHTKLNNLPITQFYTCEIDNSNPKILYGGTQDNSTMRTQNGEIDDWEIIYVGDGFYTLVDPSDNSFVYTEYQYGNFAKSTDGGNNFLPATAGISVSDRKNWKTPVVFEPNNPAVLYYGANKLYRSNNRAENWELISPDLSNGTIDGVQSYGTITCISVSPANTDIIYAGTDDGNVWVTLNRGLNWDKISNDLPNRWVTSIATHATEPDVAYVTFSGYRYNSDLAHVFKTSNNGDSWEDISGNLPDVPINKILYLQDPEVLVLATDIGVFIAMTSDSDWELLGKDLPNVVVTDLDYNVLEQKLVAATYGRSMYSYDMDFEVSLPTVLSQKSNARIFPNPSSGNSHLVFTPLTKELHSINLFDANGKWIRNILDQHLTEEETSLALDGSDLPPGNYFIQIKTPEAQFSKKWVLVE